MMMASFGRGAKQLRFEDGEIVNDGVFVCVVIPFILDANLNLSV